MRRYLRRVDAGKSHERQDALAAGREQRERDRPDHQSTEWVRWSSGCQAHYHAIPPPESAIALVGDMSVLVPMAGLIDAAAEAERIGKQLAKAHKDLALTQKKLGNENFVRNAPPEVVEQERTRIADLERTVTNLTAQLERVRRLFEP